MENNNNGPLGQEAHNDPKQKLSYFENPNHVESRHLDTEEDLEGTQHDKNATPDSNSYEADNSTSDDDLEDDENRIPDSEDIDESDYEDFENKDEDAFRTPGL